MHQRPIGVRRVTIAHRRWERGQPGLGDRAVLRDLHALPVDFHRMIEPRTRSRPRRRSYLPAHPHQIFAPQPARSRVGSDNSVPLRVVLPAKIRKDAPPLRTSGFVNTRPSTHAPLPRTEDRRGFYFTSTKKERQGRRIALHNEASTLLDQRDLPPRERQSTCNDRTDAGLVFPSTRGTPMFGRNLHNRCYRPALDARSEGHSMPLRRRCHHAMSG